MTDNRFPSPGVDARFPTPGVDARFPSPGIDLEHLPDGTDTRFQGTVYGGFSPAVLFAGGDQGAWYEPSDLTTLFQDTAGTTPVTTVGQTVGRMLDKSGRGNHATQPTAAARPTYGVVPATGRRNLLLRSEDLANAQWNPGAISTGTRTNGTLAVTTDEGYAYIYQNAFGGGPAGTYAVSFDVVCDTTVNNLPLRVSVFDVNASALVNVVSGVSQRVTIICAGVSSFTTVDGLSIGIDARDAIVPGGSNATGYNLTINRVQLEVAASATAYQRVTSQFDVTEAGVASLGYLAFDGVDDFLVTPTITPGTDKAQVFAGVRKLSDAAQQVVLGLGNITEAGGLEMFAPTSAAANNFGFGVNGGTGFVQATSSGAFAGPVSVLATAIVDISLASGELTTRMNGVVASTSGADTGTGNLRTDTMNIGRRDGSSLPFPGHLYSLISRFGANLTADQITATETWVAAKTGVTL